MINLFFFKAMQHKKREKVIEFFDVYGPELHGKPEWSQWFGKIGKKKWIYYTSVFIYSL